MSNRRDFLKTSAAVGGVAVAGNLAAGAFAAGNDTIKVGLIGCGGRGKGAVRDILIAVLLLGVIQRVFLRALTS